LPTITVVGPAGSALVLASFLYKLTTGVFAILWLRSDVGKDKDVEILVLRHQLAVLRQVATVRTRPADRAVLAPLSRLLSPVVPRTLAGVLRADPVAERPIPSADCSWSPGHDGPRSGLAAGRRWSRRRNACCTFSRQATCPTANSRVLSSSGDSAVVFP
jgi:hypothetical protein